MKLSQVQGERTIDVIAEIIEPVTNIAMDKTAKELFSRKQLPEGLTPNEFFAKRLKENAPTLLKTHKSDFIQIFAAIEGKTVEEYSGELNLVKMINDLIELLTDEVFLSLFQSAQAKTESASSGNAQENTKAQKT